MQVESLSQRTKQAFLESGARLHRYKRNEVPLVGEEHVIFVSSGVIAESRIQNKRIATVLLNRSGDLAGGALTDTTDFAKVLTPAVVFTLPRRRVDSSWDHLIEEHAKARTARLKSHTASLTTGKTINRVAHALDEIYGDGRVSEHIAQEDIADYVGKTRQTVNEAYVNLKNRNIITVTRYSYLKIIDREKLIKIANAG